MKAPVFVESELRAFYDLCEQMEREGNKGWYSGDLSRMGYTRFAFDRKFVAHRKGIIFYSGGWGWRLRKNWRETFGQRFYETVVNWQDAKFVS